MADLGLDFVSNGQAFFCDLAPGSKGGLALDGTLRSAVLVSLFTDRRANADDTLPDGGTDRRGFWGDIIAPDQLPEGSRRPLGSRLWLLAREKQTDETRHRAEAYAAEALQWLIDDGIAAAVTVRGEWVARGVLALAIAITRPGAVPERYTELWRLA
jgi:phage gp46-like protein